MTLRPALFTIAACVAWLVTVGASAQTLTVEIDAEIPLGGPAAPTPAAPRYAAPPSAPPLVVTVPGPEAPARDASAPLVIVPPVEDRATPRSSAEWAGPAPRSVLVGPAPSEPPTTTADPGSDEPEIQGAIWLGVFVENMNLSRLDLSFDNPEIGALGGLQLDDAFSGNFALRSVTVGGAGIGFGIRTARIIRGPELRILVGGGEANGAWANAPGDSGLQLAARSIFLIRLETVIGLQAELGPVTPYVLARAAVGGAFIDYAVRDQRLGTLGEDGVAATSLELGMEAGLEVDLGDGVELGAAFRGSFLGTESLGGMLTIGCDTE